MTSRRRIRVVHVIARLNVGGPAVQVAELADGLDTDRYETLVLSGSVEAGEADYLKLYGRSLTLVDVPGLSRSVTGTGDLQALRGLTRALRRLRPDIVHTHTAKAGTLGRAAAALVRVPHRVHTFHGHVLHGYFSPRGVAAVRTVERVLARRTDRLIAVGQQVRDDLLAAGIGRPEQYCVMPPGVRPPPAPDRHAARQALEVPDDTAVVAFVGRLTHVKRPDRFLELAAQLLHAGRDVVFLIAGDGPLLPKLQAQAAGHGDRVRFLGWRADVGTIYAAADVLVLTSDNEGMPVALIEAALCGRAAVTTGVGSAAEVVRDEVTGLVTVPSVPALAAAVGRLLDDDGLRQRMGPAAAEDARTRFGVATLVTATSRLYEDVLRARGS